MAESITLSYVNEFGDREEIIQSPLLKAFQRVCNNASDTGNTINNANNDISNNASNRNNPTSDDTSNTMVNTNVEGTAIHDAESDKHTLWNVNTGEIHVVANTPEAFEPFIEALANRIHSRRNKMM